MDQLFASMNRNLDTGFATKVASNLAMAQDYGVKLVAYEAGQGLDQNGTNKTMDYQAQNDPRMYDIYKRLIDTWDQIVGGADQPQQPEQPLLGHA